MLAKRTSLVPALFVFLSLLGTSTAKAAPAPCYTLESLKGSFTIIGHYGAQVAIALTKASFDGKGNMTATFVVNEPTPGSTTGQRTLVNGSQTGTYTVNCDGTGVVNRFVTTSSGVTATVVSDFVITHAVRSPSEDGVLIATELKDAQRTPSAIVPGGIFLTRSYTRVPDAGDNANSQ